MRKNALEIYNNIVTAAIGEPVTTKHKSGIEYNQTIEDALRQQGYKPGIDYESIFDWRTARTYYKKLAPISSYKEPQHDLKIGDVIYNSWGYDQTNIDYYQVVDTTAKTVSIREIKTCTVNYNAQQMTGHSKPATDRFESDKVIRKTPYLFMGEWRVSFEFGTGGKWDGRPMDFSCYA